MFNTIKNIYDMMKNNRYKLFLLLILLNSKEVLANSYVVSSYNELMNLNLSSGDTVVVNGMITLENNIDNKFDGLDLNFVGANENSGFNGDNKYYGFVFNQPSTITFKNFIFEDFANSTNFGGVVGYDGINDNLHLFSTYGDRLIFRNNAGDSNGVLYSLGGNLQIQSNNYGNITFENNSSLYAGGAISLERYANLQIETNSNGQVNFIGNRKTFDSSSSGSLFNAGGGAIINQQSSLNIMANSGSINFINNYAVSGQGGAIYNFSGTAFNITANGGAVNFLNNTAEINGGAIFNNDGNFDIIANSGSVNFYGNKANEGGGAIYLYDNTGYNTNTEVNIISNGGSVNFLNNTAGTFGGAININEAGSTINLTANGGNITFSNNTDSNGYNAIYITGSSSENTTINANASYGSSITFNDSITGSTNNVQNQVLNINNNFSNGEININDSLSNLVINIYNGTINIGEYNGRYGNFDSSNTLNLYGGNINLFNSHTDNLILTTLDGNVNVGLEIDMSNLNNSDTISKATNFNYISGGINISKIKLINEIQNNLTLHMDQATNIYEFISFNNLEIESNIFDYEVSYNEETNDLNFVLLRNIIGNDAKIYNQEILNVPISTFAGSYLSQLNVYDQVLNSDFNNSNRWRFYFKPFFASEDIDLKYNLDTRTKSYGGIVGFDSSTFDLNSVYDFKGTFGFYTGYVGSHSKYKNVKVNQDGALIGLKLDTLFGKKLFATLATNAIFFDNEAKYENVENNFDSYLISFAFKTGYNFDYNVFDDSILTIQPSLNLFYSLIHNNGYTTQNNAFIKTNNMIDIFTLSPEIKIKLSLFDNTFIPYLNIAGVFNMNNSTNFMVDSFKLIDFMLKNYAEYSIGFDKTFRNEEIKLFSNIGYRSGGRDGFNLNIGINLAF